MKTIPFLKNIMTATIGGAISFIIMKSLSLPEEIIIIYTVGTALLILLNRTIKDNKYKKHENNLNKKILLKTKASLLEPMKLKRGYFYILEDRIFFLIVEIGGRTHWEVHKEKRPVISQIEESRIKVTILAENFIFHIPEAKATLEKLKTYGWI